MISLSSLFAKYVPNVDRILLRQLAGDRVQASHAQGKTLENHLYGTQRVLEAWGESLAMQRAGLCHSLYSTDAFEQVSVPLTDRDRVRSLIGKQAEELVFLFCAIHRAPFFRSLVRLPSMEESVSIPIEVRQGFIEAGQSIAGSQARDLLVLHLANQAEQAGSRHGQLTPWLEQMQRLVRILADKAPTKTPMILLEVREIGRYAERQALTYYIDATQASADPVAAAEGMEEVARLLPPIAEPHIWTSFFSFVSGDRKAQRHHARLAIDKLRAFGTAWDKRLTFDEWMGIAQIGRKKNPPGNAFDPLRRILGTDAGSDRIEHSGAKDAQSGSGVDVGKSRFESYLQTVAASKSRKISGFYPGLRQDHFWPAENFELAHALHANFLAIQKEIDSLSPEQFHNEAENIDRTGAWKIFMLLEAGRWHEENIKQLPVLSAILRSEQEIRIAGGLVYLSRLSPGTVVAPHTGPTNMRLRLHFGIHVPRGDCAMRVAGIEKHWLEGRSIVFNDFWQHEVWNNTDSDRLILLVDLWHPDITPRERSSFEAIHWISEQHGRGLFEYWKKNEAMRRGSDGYDHPKPMNVDDLVL